ncbi:MAG: hypothetical protein AAF591_19440 [Verrucomicrobiota bacterium]
MSKLYDLLYLDVTLRPTGIILGILLIAIHVYCLLQADKVGAWLKKFPRNKTLGVIILAIDALWCYMLINNMDLGEFFTVRRFVQLAIPLGFFLIITFSDEFLAVRAFGLFLLLAACPVLTAAFLQPPLSRLLLPILAYAWIIVGLFFVGMPYLMRDGIDWITAKPKRWTIACSAGAAYGALILACALAFY